MHINMHLKRAIGGSSNHSLFAAMSLLSGLTGLACILCLILPTFTYGKDFDLNKVPNESEFSIVTTPQPPPLPPAPVPISAQSWMQRLKERTRGAIKNALERLPKYFDFDAFKRNFKRRYTDSESLYRKSVFLQRCLEVFKARVAFRLGRSSYVLGINKFADRSPNEIKRMYMSGPPIELRPAGQSESEYYRELERVARKRAQWDAELPSRATLYENSLDEEEVNDNGNSEATIISESQVRAQIESMLKGNSYDNALQAAIREELTGADRETFSQGSLEQSVARPKPLPWPGKLRSPMAPPAKVTTGGGIDLNAEPTGEGDMIEVVNDGSSDAPRVEYVAPNLEEGDTLDWSAHKCFHQIYDQGVSCGKCYVMASTALAEFYKCSEKEDVVKARKFSKEYVLGCSQKYSPANLGCIGGSMLDTLRFIARAGIYNIRGWGVKRQQEVERIKATGVPISNIDLKCPLNPLLAPIERWGEIKVEMNPKVVHTNDWLAALQDGPIVASVQMPSVGMETYEGGVHDGTGCETSGNWHAMILVGYGTNERGITYWRFRNSYGQDWGESGHINLAMSVPSACLAGGVRIYREPFVL